MNIVVIGGGTPGKFGYDFVKRARGEGHNVLVMSHRSQFNDPQSVVANFSNLENSVESFQKLTSNLDHIDIFLYNTNISGDYLGGWPHNSESFKTSAVISEKLYVYGFRIHVIIPHALSIEALKKMNEKSKICFMTTDMIYDKEREKYIERLGYSGGKSYQHQLMLALAKYNDVGAIVSSVSPHFNYNDKVDYEFVFNKAYEHIINHDAQYNGKVFDCWD